MSVRPVNEKDLITKTNGDPVFLGMLVSTGAAVNNVTTATPFNAAGRGPNGADGFPVNLDGTLAGKTLLLQTTAAGLIKTSNNPNMTVGSVSGQNIIALQSVVPPLAGTEPGVALASGERVELIMMPLNGWLQWLPVSGSANCLVWELR